MDTSETYIKMSHLAFPEPETLPEPPCHKVQEHIYVDTQGQWWADWQGWWIPLYRQDQLQEMGKDQLFLRKIYFQWSEDNLIRMIWAVGDDNIVVPATSMEQLWLAFVMRERYGKV